MFTRIQERKKTLAALLLLSVSAMLIHSTTAEAIPSSELQNLEVSFLENSLTIEENLQGKYLIVPINDHVGNIFGEEAQEVEASPVDARRLYHTLKKNVHHNPKKPIIDENLSDSTSTLTSNDTTVACPQGCSSCDTQGVCKACSSAYFAHNTTVPTSNSTAKATVLVCVKSCPQSTYPEFTTGRCTACQPGCDVCSKHECFQCSMGTPIISNVSNSLKCGCAKNQYLVNNATCSACPATCTSCDSAFNCLSCSPFNRLSNGACVETCSSSNVKQFVDADSTCKNCDATCGTCDRSSNNCTSCKSGQQLISNVCYQPSAANCPKGFFYLPSSKACQPCAEGCTDCKSADYCNSCDVKKNFFLHNVTVDKVISTSCVTECPAGYRSDSNGTCEACSDSDCLSCPKAVDQCESCATKFSHLGNCITKTCPSGSFQPDILEMNCLPCPEGCATCNTTDTCLSCAKSHMIVRSSNINVPADTLQRALGVACVQNKESCPDGTYKEKGTCVSCKAGCGVCSSIKACQAKCPSNCTDCTGSVNNQNNKCITCTPKYQFFNDDQYQFKCLSLDCSTPGQYFNSDSKSCEKCDENCDKCSSPTQCKTCSSGFVLIPGEQSVCATECPAGTYADSTGTCVNCAVGCDSCSTLASCNTCSIHAVLNPSDSQCYCGFAHQIVPYLSQGSLMINTLNLNWDSSHFGVEQNCNKFLSFTLAKQAKIADLNSLTCTLNSVKSTTNQTYPKNMQDNVARLTVKGWTNVISAHLLTNQLNITLNKASFSQFCKDHSVYNYQVSIPVDTSRDVFNPSFNLTASKLKVARCQTSTVSSTFTKGYTTFKNVVWSVSVISSNASYTNDATNLQKALVAASKTTSDSFTVFANLTQYFTANVTLNITLTASNDINFNSSASFFVGVVGTIDELAPADSETFMTNADQPFVPKPVFSHPQCAVDSGKKYANELPLSAFNCVVLNSTQHVVLKNLVNCTIPQGSLMKNKTYFLNYTVTPSTYQNAVTGQIKLKTSILVPTCKVNGPDNWVISPNKDTLITGQALNTDTVTYYYRWSCSNSTTPGSCPYVVNGALTPEYFIAKDSFAPEKTYTFTMKVLNDAMEEIASCSKSASIASQCQSINVDITSLNHYTAGYFDSSVDQYFVCDSGNQIDITTGLQYTWSITERFDDDDLLDLWTSAGVRITGKTLFIPKDTFTSNNDYTMKCFVDSFKYCGATTIDFSTWRTVADPLKFNFVASPAKATAYSTEVLLKVVKKTIPAGCNFGFIDPVTNVRVQQTDDSEIVPKTEDEFFRIVLPTLGDGKSLEVYAQCFDLLGYDTIAVKTIKMKNSTTPNAEEAELRETFRNASMDFDIHSISIPWSAFNYFKSKISNQIKREGYDKFTNSIAKMNVSRFEVQDVDFLASILSQIAQDLFGDQIIKPNQATVEGVYAAFAKILFATDINTTAVTTTALDVEVTTPLPFKLMSVSTYKTLVVSAGLLLESTLGDDIYTLINQNLIKGLEVCALRVAANMLDSDDDIIAMGSKYTFKFMKYPKSELVDNTLSFSLESVAEVANNTVAPTISLNINPASILGASNYVLVKGILANQTLPNATNLATYTKFASNILVVTSAVEDFTRPTSGFYTVVYFEVKNIPRPFRLDAPLNDSKNDNTSSTNTCAFFDEKPKQWTLAMCPMKATKIPAEMLCCTYYAQGALKASLAKQATILVEEATILIEEAIPVIEEESNSWIVTASIAYGLLVAAVSAAIYFLSKKQAKYNLINDTEVIFNNQSIIERMNNQILA